MAQREESTSLLADKWKLNAVMALFVLLTSCRYITTKLIDETQVVNDKGETEIYRHPVVQSIAGYLGEFFIVAVFWCYYKRYDPEQTKSSEIISFLTLALPALCDFTENMCLIFGVTQIFPSLVSMSRALVLPITALLSKFLIRKVFSWPMILALVVLLSGMGVATAVQFEDEMSDESFKLTTFGIVLLAISAFIQSLEIIIENHLFLKDPAMSSFYLQMGVATWKLIFAAVLIPFCSLISVPEEYVTGGKFESFGPALSILFSHSSLIWLFLLMATSNGLHAILGVSIIHDESAMQRQSAMMLVVPAVWIFFFLYDGEGDAEFGWKLGVGMSMLVIGTFWYITSDRDQSEESSRAQKDNLLSKDDGEDDYIIEDNETTSLLKKRLNNDSDTATSNSLAGRS